MTPFPVTLIRGSGVALVHAWIRAHLSRYKEPSVLAQTPTNLVQLRFDLRGRQLLRRKMFYLCTERPLFLFYGEGELLIRVAVER